MIHSKKIDLITKALIEAEKEFKSISLTQEAKAGSFSFKYADLTEVYNATKQALNKAGIKSTGYFRVGDDGDNVFGMMLSHESGQWIKSERKEKVLSAKPTDLGSFITYMRRYLYVSLVGVAADEDVEGSNLNETCTVEEKSTPNPRAKGITEDHKEALMEAIGDDTKLLEHLYKKFKTNDLGTISRGDYLATMEFIKTRNQKGKGHVNERTA